MSHTAAKGNEVVEEQQVDGEEVAIVGLITELLDLVEFANHLNTTTSKCQHHITSHITSHHITHITSQITLMNHLWGVVEIREDAAWKCQLAVDEGHQYQGGVDPQHEALNEPPPESKRLHS